MPRFRQRSSTLAITLAALLAFAACAAPADPATALPVPTAQAAPQATPRATPADHDAARARVDALVGARTCTADAQCHTVAEGARACGGPTGYRAWSDTLTDGSAIEAAAAQERKLALEIERQSGRASICLFAADPGAQCVKGRCETNTGAMPAPRPAAQR